MGTVDPRFCFYLVGFVLTNQRERASQVVALLEYAVNHTDEPAKARHVVDTGHDDPSGNAVAT